MVALGARVTGHSFGVGFGRAEPQSITLHPGVHATTYNLAALSRRHCGLRCRSLGRNGCRNQEYRAQEIETGNSAEAVNQ
jgi:hypothetical protein